jgi:hypothetical protein
LQRQARSASAACRVSWVMGLLLVLVQERTQRI